MSRLRPCASLPSHQCLGKHDHLAGDTRQFAIAGPVERELDLALAGLLALDDVTVIPVEHRAVLLQRIEREDNILRRHRLAVVPACGRVQTIDGPGKIVGIGDGIGEQPVSGRRFIQRAGGQRLEDLADAVGERSLHTIDDQIEVVEGAEREHADDAALGGIRPDVVVVLEAGGILDVTQGGDPMPPFESVGRGLRLCRREPAKIRCESQCRDRRGDGAALQKMSSGYRQKQIPVYRPGASQRQI